MEVNCPDCGEFLLWDDSKGEFCTSCLWPCPDYLVENGVVSYDMDHLTACKPPRSDVLCRCGHKLEDHAHGSLQWPCRSCDCKDFVEKTD